MHEAIALVAAERDEPELLELAPKLHAWQRWFLIHALELLPGADQLFRFRIVLLLVARQNGKTAILVYLILWRMFTDGARLVIGSAQTIDVAEETWETVVAIAEAIPDLDDELKDVKWGSGKRKMVLDSLETYRVVPSTRGGGRSKSAELVGLDELREHQTWDAWGAITKTTMARPRGQVFGFSNAGDAQSIVLGTLRKTAHKALGDPDNLAASGLAPEDDGLLDEDLEQLIDYSMGIFEWSAAPGMALTNREGWCMANPSLGLGGITERAIASAVANEPEWVVRTEVLCQWNEGTTDGPFPGASWAAAPLPDVTNEDGEIVPDPEGGCFDPLSKRSKKSRLAVGIDTSWDKTVTYIAWAAFRKDGLVHVELTTRRAGIDWAIPWVKERIGRMGIDAVAFQCNGAPVSILLDKAQKEAKKGFPFVEWSGSDLGRWTGMLFNLVTTRRLRHLGQGPLSMAAAFAAIKPAGDGAFIWDRKASPVDIAALVAVTAAVGALLTEAGDQRSAYEDDDAELVVL